MIHASDAARREDSGSRLEIAVRVLKVCFVKDLLLHKNFGPNVVFETLDMNIWKTISIGKFAGESGAHEAPYVALFIWSMQPEVGESPGATTIAAPLEIR